MRHHLSIQAMLAACAGFLVSGSALASEAELHIPELNQMFTVFGSQISGTTILGFGMVVAFVGLVFGVIEFLRIKALPAHDSLLEVSALIYENCKTYLFQQGKLLLVLEAFIGACMFYYFFGLGLQSSCSHYSCKSRLNFFCQQNF
jgi:K(+)-stimulated pyrophosphate-energized sodium pump